MKHGVVGGHRFVVDALCVTATREEETAAIVRDRAPLEKIICSRFS